MRVQNQILVLRVMAAGLLIACALFAVSPTAADDGETCTNIFRDAAGVIAACTRAIASGQYTAENAATLYTSRALMYAAKGQFDHALQDFDEAIRLDPQFAHGDETDPVSVGDGRYIVCCRAVVLDCRVKASWRLRDDISASAKRCVGTCWRKPRC